ncbi:hypothetical protein NDU88_007999 [Pleurodeles waltl]|uniref:Uncharacterized protein n=1 Tax=Pleurodeles waltl TaxID=8319 RepID=A0AAV7QQM1_PLEWA|nr:hypothetical protein NDU88_007999 [Pleurodeles waltl]
MTGLLPEAQGDLCKIHRTPVRPERRTRGERPSPPTETVELAGVKRAGPGATTAKEDEEVRPGGRRGKLGSPRDPRGSIAILTRRR